MSFSSTTPSPQAAVSAASFVNSIGVNTAVGDSGSSYGNFSQVEYALAYLGVQNDRDAYRSPYDAYDFQVLATQLGMKFDFFIAPGSYGMAWQLAQIEADPSIVRFVEGANESDLTSQTYNGLTGMAATQAEQAALYSAIEGDPALAGTPVIQASFALSASFGAAGNLSADSNYGNTHEYFMNGAAPGPNISQYVSLAQEVAPGQPIIATEAGYYTMPSASGVDDTVQAKYDLDLLFDDWQAGINMTYLYELFDEGADPTGSNSLMHFGLFDSSGDAKPAAVAVHNLIALLNDPGGSTATGTLDFGLSGMPSTAHDLLMVKSNGTFVLALWNELPLWNPATASEITNAAVPITLSLGQTYQSVTVFDPLAGVLPTASYVNTQQVSLSLLDHPILVEISPTALPQLALVQPTITELVQAGQASGNLWSFVLANADESNGAYTSDLTVSSVNTSGTTGTVTFNAATGMLSYAPAAYNPFATLDSFAYTVTDGHGGTASGTLDVLIAPPPDTTYGMSADTAYMASSTGWTLYSEASGQTLIGASAGADTLDGSGDTTITAYGTGNLITGTAGNHTVATGSGTATVTLADGSNTISGSGAGNTIVSGNGNSSVFGMTGSTSVTLGNGNQNVTLTGAGNTVTTGVGTSSISTGTGGNESVTVAGGTNEIVVGGTGDLVHVLGGTNNIQSSTGQSVFLLDAGSNTLTAAGIGNTVVGGSGVTSLSAAAGGAVVSLGDADNNIQLGGANNTVSVGNGNNTIIAGTGGAEVVVTGTGSNQITVGGLNDAVEVAGGINSIVSQTGQATIVLQAGTNAVDAAGSGNVILGGSGNTTVTGPTGSSWVMLSNGQNSVQLSGNGNTVLLNGGTTSVGAGTGNDTVIAAGGGINQVSLGGTGDLVVLTGGTNLVGATVSQSVLVAASGANVTNLQGNANTIIGGSESDTITIAGSSNVAVAGSGTETISFIQSGNTVVAGSGSDAIYDSSGGDNTVVLAAPGGQETQLYGAVTTNGDTFDLRDLLAGTSWNGATASLGSFLSMTSNGLDAVLSVDPTGQAGAGYQPVADLHAAGSLALTSFLTHAIV